MREGPSGKKTPPESFAPPAQVKAVKDPAAPGHATARAAIAESAQAAVAITPDAIRERLSEAVGLGARARDVRRKGQLVDRKAAAYVSNLVRQCARLISQLPDSVPVLRPAAGSGVTSLRHHVVRHDQFENPPRVRLLVVSSDGRLRTCTVVEGGGAQRIWEYYDVQEPPVGLEIDTVFAALSQLIVRLEGAVVDVEQKQVLRERLVSTAIESTDGVLGTSPLSAHAVAQREARGSVPAVNPPISSVPSVATVAGPLEPPVAQPVEEHTEPESADAFDDVSDLFGDVQTTDEPSTAPEKKSRGFRFSRIHKTA